MEMTMKSLRKITREQWKNGIFSKGKFRSILKESVNPNLFIIGLDISSSCTGYSIINSNREFVEAGSISIPRKFKTYPAVTMILDELKSKIQTYSKGKNEVILYAEDYLKNFGSTKFKIQNLFKLCQVNSIICYCLHIAFQIECYFAHPSLVRNFFSVDKLPGVDIKESVYNFLKPFLPAKYIPEKKKDISYDMTDSCLISLYGYYNQLFISIKNSKEVSKWYGNLIKVLYSTQLNKLGRTEKEEFINLRAGNKLSIDFKEYVSSSISDFPNISKAESSINESGEELSRKYERLLNKIKDKSSPEEHKNFDQMFDELDRDDKDVLEDLISEAMGEDLEDKTLPEDQEKYVKDLSNKIFGFDDDILKDLEKKYPNANISQEDRVDVVSKLNDLFDKNKN